jgi:RHS repeat-associated protein
VAWRNGRTIVAVLLSLGFAQLSNPALAEGAPPMTVPGQFAVSSSGAATYSIPIAVPPGTAGMVPAISLDYSSQGGDGIVGLGWSLHYGVANTDRARTAPRSGGTGASRPMAIENFSDGSSAGVNLPASGQLGTSSTLGDLTMISRCPRTMAQDGIHGGVNYDSNDGFCMEGQRLISVGADSSGGTGYRTEIDHFSRIVAYGTAGNGPAYFKVWTKAGVIMEFGNTTDSKILAVGTPTIRAWAVNRIADSQNNYLTVVYTNDAPNGQAYPYQIKYTGNTTSGALPYNLVEFSYNTARADVTPLYQAGSLSQTTVLLTHIKTYQNSSLVSDYQLGYRAGASATILRSRLTSVTLCEAGGTCLAPTTFGWQGGTGSTLTIVPRTIFDGTAHNAAADFNGDGLIDLPGDCYNNAGIYAGTESDTFIPVLAPGSPANTYTSVCSETRSDADGAWVASGDFNADGMADIFVQHIFWQTNDEGDRWPLYWYLPNLQSPAGWFTAHDVYGISNVVAGDFNGDGRTDFIDRDTHPTSSSLYAKMSNGDGLFTSTLINGLAWEAGATGDFDGDGCTDLYSSEIVFQCHPAVVTAPAPALGSGSTEPVFGDFNGDGKTDMIVVPASGVGSLYLSTGTGFAAPIAIQNLIWRNYSFATGDWNGDGKTDIVLAAKCMYQTNGGSDASTVYCASSGTLTGPHLVFLSTGTGFVLAGTITSSALPGSVYPQYIQPPVVADFNNDGVPDIEPNDNQSFYSPNVFQFTYTPELMVWVDNGLGATTNITYDRLNKNAPFYTKGSGAAYPAQDLDYAMYVVAKVDSSNGLATTSCTQANLTNCFTTTYAYAGARTDLAGRGFLGFTSVASTDSRTGIKQTTVYRTDFPYAGLVASQTAVTTRSGNGCVAGATVRSVVNTYGTPTPTVPATPLFVALQNTVVSGTDCDGVSPLPLTTTAYSNYDANGNAGLITQTVQMSGSLSFTGTSDSLFDTNWPFAPTRTITTNTVAGGAALTRHVAYEYAPGTDFLTKETIESGNADLQLVTLYGLDSATGVVVQTTVTAAHVTDPRITQFGYDSQFRFVTSITNAKGQVDTFANDPGFGGLTRHTDPNLAATTWVYDGFGRKTRENRPDGTYTLLSYLSGGGQGASVYRLSSTPYASGSTQNGPAKMSYLDALGRDVFDSTDGFAASISHSASYDINGHLAQDSRPYLSTAYFATYAYDDLGRVVGADMPVTRDDVPGTGHTTTLYQGLKTTVTNDLGQATVATRNPQGLNATVKDAQGNSTSYVYDSFGNVLKITDTASHDTTNVYDLRGNRTSTADLDMGIWYYTYDGLGELLTQKDAKNQTTTLTYDKLGRVTQSVNPGMTAAWTWDTAAHGVGQLATATTDNGYVRTHTYDGIGRPVGTTIAIWDSSYSYATTYDAATGQVGTVHYPSGFTALYTYTARGYLNQIKDNASGTVLFTAQARDADLHLTQALAGNGVTTTNTYWDQTGLLRYVRAGAGDNIANFTYRYDSLGNVTYRADGYNNVFERFCYDSLNRLTLAALSHPGDPGTSCTAPGGTVKTVVYDAIGNILSKTGVGAYSYNAGTRPHAIDSIAGTVNGVTNPHFTYDLNGNMTAGAGRSVSYTAFNMTQSIYQGDNQEEYIYDPEHSRVELYDYQGESANVLYYLNDPNTGAMSEMSWVDYTWHDYLKVDGKLIAERFCPVGATCSSTTAWRYFVTDSLGSVATVTDSTASPDAPHTERDAYDPWGKKRSPITGADDNSCYSASISDRGYTGHEHINGVCLINENARVYDPLLGRFMAPDDVIADIYDGQGLNRYTYVDNRPMTLTDPTGHVMVWDDVAEVGAVIACAGPQALVCAGVAVVVIGGGILCYEYCGQWFGPSTKNGSPPSQPAGATPPLPPSTTSNASPAKPIQASPADKTKPSAPPSAQPRPSDRPAGPDGKKGSIGGPGAGKRFPAESPGVRGDKEGVPCRYCGRPTTNEPGSGLSRERDHIDPRSRGGNNEPENEGDACRDCNRGKGARNPDEWEPATRFRGPF